MPQGDHTQGSSRDQRLALVVEQEYELAQGIERDLSPYGFEVQIVGSEQEALERAAGMQSARRPSSAPRAPDLIILCVELGDASGYTICKKLKGDTTLRHIPIIITSAQATPADFERHRRLPRMRADDYLIKPFGSEELLTKVDRLVGLGNGGNSSPLDQAHTHQSFGEYFTESGEYSANEATAIEQPIELDASELLSDSAPQLHPNRSRPDHRESVDQEIERETDAAFALLESSERAPTSPAKADLPPDDAGPGSERMEEEGEELEVVDLALEDVESTPGEEEVTTNLEPLDRADVEPTASGYPAPSEVDVAPPSDDTPPTGVPGENDDGAAERQVMQSASIGSSGSDPALTRRGTTAPREEAVSRSEQPVGGAEGAAGAATLPASANREREILTLREKINRKEREILDLRDDLDARERQILDHRDKVRESERRLRDLDERSLQLESELMTAREHLEAALADKRNVLERESGIKRRLEEAKAEIDKAHAENSALKSSHRDELAQIQQQQQQMAQRYERERQEALDQAQRELEEQLRKLKEEGEAKLAEQSQQHAQAFAELESQRRADSEQAQRAHERELERLRLEMEAALAQREQEFQKQKEQAAEQHRGELVAREERFEGEKASLREEHEHALAEKESRRHSDLADAQSKFDQELAQLRRESEQKLIDITQLQQEQLDALRRRSQQEIEQLHAEYREELESERARGLEAREQAERDGQALLAQAKEEHASFVETLRAQHASREEELKHLHAVELEEREIRHRQQVKSMEAEQEAAVQTLRNDHQQQIEAMESGHSRALEQLAEEHRHAVEEQTHGHAAELSQARRLHREEAAALIAERQAVSETLAQTEQALKEARENLAKRDVRLEELRDELDHYRGGLASARRELAAAREALEIGGQLGTQAQRAMAVAISLLEQQKAASSPSADAQIAASAKGEGSEQFSSDG